MTGTATAVKPRLTSPLGLTEAVSCELDGAVRLTTPAEDAAAHRRRFGAAPTLSRGALTDLVAQAALTGRGGAHFPVARKWRTIAASEGPAVVVANAAESEPASAKDAVLLQRFPHLVLDGLAACARELGADTTIVWLHEGDDATLAALRQAQTERQASGTVEPRAQFVTGPARYLTGESSALLSGLNGGAVLPTFRRVPAARSGFDGRPTAIHNVETLARVALLARERPAAGGLFTVVTRRRTVIETSGADTFAEVLARAGVSWAPTAVLLGGYGGSWVPWQRLAHTPADPAGADIGAGVLIPLATRHCGLATTAAIATYLAEQSARQCGPCRFGLPELARQVSRLARGGRHTTSAVTELSGLVGEVTGRGGCSHPDGATSLVVTAMRVFAPDITSHRDHRRCLGSGEAAHLPGIGR
ncbi:MAG: NADH-ubiquinone oxidoreductase-F iron-sulfur binding region domain-containing protein [Kineosporiaceae bacterium]